MQRDKALKEIHDIMEQIYEEEKGLSRRDRLKRLKKEVEAFQKERDLGLRRASLKVPNKSQA